jgi:hypothetical protein
MENWWMIYLLHMCTLACFPTSYLRGYRWEWVQAYGVLVLVTIHSPLKLESLKEVTFCTLLHFRLHMFIFPLFQQIVHVCALFLILLSSANRYIKKMLTECWAAEAVGWPVNLSGLLLCVDTFAAATTLHCSYSGFQHGALFCFKNVANLLNTFWPRHEPRTTLYRKINKP